MAIRINRVYTRTGDQGETGLVGGQRVPKDALRIECYGTVDELNATLGILRVHTGTGASASLLPLDDILMRVQNELFNLGSMLATPVAVRHEKQPVIAERHVARLEHDIDQHNEGLPELRSFVLPGGGEVVARLHLARTVCRRAERLLVTLLREEPGDEVALRYLNRLSDALFVFSRWAAHVLGESEHLWRPECT